MQVTIKAVSSILNDSTVLIETHLTIGENTTTQRAGYDLDDLMENRFLTGTAEDRIEFLRAEAQKVAEMSFNAQYAVLLSHIKGRTEATTSVNQNQPVVDQAEMDAITLAAESKLQGVQADVLIVDDVAPATSKPRAKRATKPTESK